MRFRLRTLLIVLALGPPVLSIGYVKLASHFAWRHRNDGPLVQQAKFLGNRAYSDKKLLRLIGVHDGLHLNAYAAGQSLQEIKAFYVQQGFPQAKVTLLEGGRPGDKKLAFQIVEGDKAQP